jgi:hypothetical protein
MSVNRLIFESYMFNFSLVNNTLFTVEMVVLLSIKEHTNIPNFRLVLGRLGLYVSLSEVSCYFLSHPQYLEI